MADPIATSADYADAMIVARRAKHWLFLFVLLMLLLQITFFFIARYTDVLERVGATTPGGAGAASAADVIGATTAAAATTTAAEVTTSATEATGRPNAAYLWLNYLTGFTTFLGTVLPILLALVLLLILNIMLIGRLIGVSRVTSAFLWCLLLALLMFPWQVFFGGTTDPADFRWPGVLYTWDDLVLYAKFPTSDLRLAILKWTRFFVAPLAAVILLLMVQAKSNRGLRQALGEAGAEPHITM